MSVDLVPDRLERARPHGVEVVHLADQGDVLEFVRSITDGRGPISMVDVVGLLAHGAPIRNLAHRLELSQENQSRAFTILLQP